MSCLRDVRPLEGVDTRVVECDGVGRAQEVLTLQDFVAQAVLNGTCRTACPLALALQVAARSTVQRFIV